MNRDQTLSLFRDILKIVGMALVANGAVSAGQWEIWTTIGVEIVGCALVVGPIIASQFAHTDAAKVASVAAMPGTIVSPEGTKITIVEPKLAEAAKEAATPAAGK